MYDRMKATTIGSIAGALLVTGCGPAIRAMPLGHMAPAKPPSCAIREERVTSREAQDRYDQVGVLCYARIYAPVQEANTVCSNNGGVVSCQSIPKGAARDPLLDDVREDACRLGGEIVVRHGFCEIAQQPAMELGVYVARAPRSDPAGSAAR